jgi:hypothetical protein
VCWAGGARCAPSLAFYTRVHVGLGLSLTVCYHTIMATENIKNNIDFHLAASVEGNKKSNAPGAHTHTQLNYLPCTPQVPNPSRMKGQGQTITTKIVAVKILTVLLLVTEYEMFLSLL